MIFALTRFPARKPRPTYRYNQHLDRPIVNLEVFGPTGSKWTEALLDSGSDDVVLHLDLAERLGVDLSTIETGTSAGVGATPSTLYYAPVILRLTDGVDVCRWRTIVAFSATLGRHSLFGIAGGLEYFRFSLDVEQYEAELIPKPTLPTTDDQFP